MTNGERLIDVLAAKPSHIGWVPRPALDLHPSDDRLVVERRLKLHQATLTRLVEVIITKFFIANLTDGWAHTILGF